MRIDDGKIALAAAAFAAIGIALLFFLSETPESASVAQSLVAPENTLVIVGGTVANATGSKFYLCDQVCVSVKPGAIPTAALLSDGRRVTVTGRMKAYQGNKYMEAEKIEFT